jgi:stage II sporulation protein P
MQLYTAAANAISNIGQNIEDDSEKESGLSKFFYMFMLKQGSPLFGVSGKDDYEYEDNSALPSGSFGDGDFIFEYEPDNSGEPAGTQENDTEENPATPTPANTESSTENPNPGGTQNPKNGKPIQAIHINPVNNGQLIINNQTKYSLDINKLLSQKPDIKIKDLSKPLVLIVHTHATEAFTENGITAYDPNQEDNRTRDITKSVVRVGDEMVKELEKLGIKALHDTKLHDYPSYNGSYKDALASIQSYLKKYPTIAIVIDIHRDSMITQNAIKYKVVQQINGKNAAQVMIIAGSDTNLSNPGWKENFKFAVRLQQKIQKSYPGLMRPVCLTTQRYNMHATHGSLIMEIGTSGNTLDEAVYSARLVATSMAQVIKELKS